MRDVLDIQGTDKLSLTKAQKLSLAKKAAKVARAVAEAKSPNKVSKVLEAMETAITVVDAIKDIQENSDKVPEVIEVPVEHREKLLEVIAANSKGKVDVVETGPSVLPEVTNEVEPVIRVKDLKFRGSTFHNLVRARKSMINTILRSAQDPKKNGDVLDTLSILTRFAKSRALHGVQQREDAIASKINADKVTKQVAAMQSLKDVETQLADSMKSTEALLATKEALEVDQSFVAKDI